MASRPVDVGLKKLDNAHRALFSSGVSCLFAWCHQLAFAAWTLLLSAWKLSTRCAAHAEQL